MVGWIAAVAFIGVTLVAAMGVLLVMKWRAQERSTPPRPHKKKITTHAVANKAPSPRPPAPATAPPPAKPLWTLSQEGETQLVTLNDNIDDEANFAGLSKVLRGEVVFDLNAVHKLSSSGVSHWINFLRSIPVDVTYRFRRCSHAFCSCASCVSGLLGRGRVESFIAPYLCEDCEHEFSVELNLDPTTVRPPRSMDCPSCTGNSILEELTERYRSFMEVARGGYFASPGNGA